MLNFESRVQVESVCEDDKKLLELFGEIQQDTLKKLDKLDYSMTEKMALLDGAISEINKYFETCSLSMPMIDAATAVKTLLEAKKEGLSENSKGAGKFQLNEKTGRYEISDVRITKSGRDFFEMFSADQRPYKIRVWKNGEPLKSVRSTEHMLFEWEEKVGQFFYRATPLYFQNSGTEIANKYEIEVVSTIEHFFEGWDESLQAYPFEKGQARFEEMIKSKRSALPERQKARSDFEIPSSQKITLWAYLKKCEKELKLSKSQYFLLVDKNENMQKVYIVYYDSEVKIAQERFRLVGSDAISTGNPNWEQSRKFDDEDHYYETPAGHFLFEDKMYYKWAANDRNFFAFGRQIAFMANKKFERIAFGMHPVSEKREQRLGERTSHGCIRISSELYSFLDEEDFLGNQMKVLLVFDSAKERLDVVK